MQCLLASIVGILTHDRQCLPTE